MRHKHCDVLILLTMVMNGHTLNCRMWRDLVCNCCGHALLVLLLTMGSEITVLSTYCVHPCLQDFFMLSLLWHSWRCLLSCGKLCANSASLTFVQDKESVMDILKIIDKSNGYVFKGIEGNINEFYKIAAAPLNWDYYRYPPCLLLYYVSVEVIGLVRTMMWLAPMKYVEHVARVGMLLRFFLSYAAVGNCMELHLISNTVLALTMDFAQRWQCRRST